MRAILSAPPVGMRLLSFYLNRWMVIMASFVPARFSAFAAAALASLAVSSLLSPAALAQTYTAPVETYTEQALPPATSPMAGPSRPLRAGEMVLPRNPSTAASVARGAPTPIASAQVPAVGLQAPRMVPPSSSGAGAPSDYGSSMSLMLMQGMKTAIIRSGENPDLPKTSSALPTVAVPSVTGQQQIAPPSLPNAQAAATAVQPPPAASQPQSDAFKYESGREPKNIGMLPSDSPSSSAASSSAPAASAGYASSMASCGSSSGMAMITAPSSGLCAAGKPSAVSGSGPWWWNCSADSGGMSVSCAAPLASGDGNTAQSGKASAKRGDVSENPENGKCGEAHETGDDEAPDSDLCASGKASRVNGNGPWTWACSGKNGGMAASCVSYRKTNGRCGTANEAVLYEIPQNGLCAAGSASVVTGQGPWNWTCSGLHGGKAEVCKAESKRDAVCGEATLSGHREEPEDGLCSVGKPSRVSGDGPWTWTCSGVNGGKKIECKVGSSVDGSCGAANGASFESAPTTGLCERGRAGNVGGSGPWMWTCGGVDGGSSASCTASMAAASSPAAAPVTSVVSSPSSPSARPDESDAASAAVLAKSARKTAPATTASCGKAADMAAFKKPVYNLCAYGSAGNVSGSSPWTWECSDKSGGKVSCSTLVPATSSTAPIPQAAPISPVVMAAKASPKDAPSEAVAKTAAVKTETKPAPKAAETAPENGTCGAANGAVFKTSPTSSLCASGYATNISGDGPWMWSCVGTGGGSSSSCSALPPSKARVDGVCGNANGTVFTKIPDSGLCDGGTPSPVHGDGPWTWTCSGMNGGNASVCSAPRAVPKAPPPPGPATDGNCGPVNGMALMSPPSGGLCSSGVATEISGNGPWNWNCVGINGGMSVSCTSPLMPPAPLAGACGTSHGVPSAVAPKSGLCSAGISSAVSGKGPWTWSCSGVNGGSAVSCVAPQSGDEAGAMPSVVRQQAGTSSRLMPPPPPSAGLVTPRLPPQSSLPAEIPVPRVKPDMAISDPVPPPSYAPAPSSTEQSGLAMPSSSSRLALPADTSSLAFANGSEALDDAAVKSLDKLVVALLANRETRVTLVAYADSNGNTPRGARRLSLSRALAVRDYLSSRGVAASRVDVRALGANVARGNPDRGDVKVN